MGRKRDSNCTRMLWAVLNKSWRQHPTKQQLYGHLPLISKTIQIRRARHVGHCWRSKGELISDIPQWTSLYGRARVGWPARTYQQQVCTDTGCNIEDVSKAIDYRDEWLERVKEIRACGMPWWWWWCTCINRLTSIRLLTWPSLSIMWTLHSRLICHKVLLVT